jgi:5-methylcytosine-specific restriction enzyme A
MPWRNSPADRRRSAATYDDPEYKRNKAAVRRRSGGRCEWAQGGTWCGSPLGVQCDHKIPRSQGGSHALANLWDLCAVHHGRKTAQEGAGFRQARDPDPAPRTAW